MTDLKQVQENVKAMVERGEISKDAGIAIILQKAVEMLEDALKGKQVYDDQSWEKKEHPEFFSEVN